MVTPAEIQALREEVARLRERVAVLEARPLHSGSSRCQPTPYPDPRLRPVPLAVPPMRQTVDEWPVDSPFRYTGAAP